VTGKRKCRRYREQRVARRCRVDFLARADRFNRNAFQSLEAVFQRAVPNIPIEMAPRETGTLKQGFSCNDNQDCRHRQ
jgi:hypothetical protein